MLTGSAIRLAVSPDVEEERIFGAAMPDMTATLPAGLPHVACILPWHQICIPPFIFREVENLKHRLPVEVYLPDASNPRHCPGEMLAVAPTVRTAGIQRPAAFFLEVLRCLAAMPAKFRRIFARSLLRPWHDLESFAENLRAFYAGVALGRQLREDGIDMIYAPWHRGAATAAWVAADIAGIPFAVSTRGDNLEPADPDTGAKFAAALFIRANSAADRERIENFDKKQAKNKVELVYNSLTLPAAAERSLPILAQNPVRLLALGRFDATKGFDVLLRACGILKNSGFDFRVTLAGGGGKSMCPGGMKRMLLALRKELDLERHVSMPGPISHDELPNVLLNHDIFAAPHVARAPGRRDGIPDTVIEALAYGLPVVGTNVNALPEVIRHRETGLLVPPGNAQALADAVLWLARHPAEARILGKNGQALVREMFDPARNCQRLSELFVRRYAIWKASCAA
ncbi:MAG: glycosyltransferase family 4 protein [Desulfovibrio sp.]|jgi:glycosyltransferase involved in cell wall biosynthesis|nr:glycosyltransferase family 4 protein [Desulfovibrio sp.]